MKFKQHVAKWRDCTDCELCNYRKQIVLARGKVPADVLYLGEAPGDSEDSIGLPFVGPAGKLRDRIVDRALEMAGVDSDRYREIVTNMVCCIPKPEGGKRDPLKAELEACGGRLRELLGIAKPRLVVTLGEVSKKWFPKIVEWSGATVNLTHPAAILRAPEDRKGLAYQASVVRLSNALEELYS